MMIAIEIVILLTHSVIPASNFRTSNFLNESSIKFSELCDKETNQIKLLLCQEWDAKT